MAEGGKRLQVVIEPVAMQLHTCNFTLTARKAVSRAPVCTADKHSEARLREVKVNSNEIHTEIEIHILYSVNLNSSDLL